jgi:hypothetical protein
MTFDEAGKLPLIDRTAITPAFGLLPANMASEAARVMLLAIGLQESDFKYRRQMGNGPARGYWQFEQGTKETRGGVWGVYLHRASNEYLRLLCRDRDCSFDPRAIWAQIEHDDVLAAGVARLMLWTDAKPLPAVGDSEAGWSYYLRTWRPGKPHPDKWPLKYMAALRFVTEGV